MHSNLAPASRGIPAVSMGIDRRTHDPRAGFAHFGEFATAVRRAAFGPASANDERLRLIAAAPTTTGSELSGSDGGFVVPQAFAQEVMMYSLADDALLRLCDTIPIRGSSMAFGVDETTPWGADGVRAYWQVEGTAGTPTKPQVRGQELRLNKLMALVPVSDELLADSPALATYLPKRIGDSIRWKLNEAILWGPGNGTPVGCLNSPAAIVVPKEGSQATNTLLIANLGRMLSRLPQGSYGRSAFLMHSDAVTFLTSLSASPIVLGPPPANFPIASVGTVCGVPIVASQHCAAFTSQGDVLLLDLSYYRAIHKDPLLQSALSLHLYFDADAAAFRVTCRIDGGPKITAPLAAAKGGTNTLSPFLQLGAR